MCSNGQGCPWDARTCFFFLVFFFFATMRDHLGVLQWARSHGLSKSKRLEAKCLQFETVIHILKKYYVQSTFQIFYIYYKDCLSQAHSQQLLCRVYCYVLHQVSATLYGLHVHFRVAQPCFLLLPLIKALWSC